MAKFGHAISYCLALLFAGLAHSETLRPYEAEYVMKSHGFTLRCHRSLSAEGQQWLLSQDASHWLVSIEESSSLFMADNQIKALDYSYHRGGVGGKDIRMSYDYQKQTLTEHYAKRAPLTKPLGETLHNKLSYQLQMRLDMARLGSNYGSQTYAFFERGKVRSYQFEYQGEEVINTPAGRYQTSRLQRQQPDKERTTTIWLAKDWDYLIVKITQEDEDGRFELALKSATLDDKPVTGLPKDGK